MNRGKHWCAVGMLLLAGILTLVGCEPLPMPPVEVYFSPKGGVTDAVAHEIDQAERSVRVQAFSFTSKPILQSLVAAHQRGVVVQVVLDRSNRTAKYSAADFVAHAGIPVLIDARHAIAHNKVIVIDDKIVITGSFNFTKQAETSNAENLLIIRDEPLAARYAANWMLHAGHSEPYQSRGGSGKALPEDSGENE